MHKITLNRSRMTYFSTLEDPRCPIKRRHQLVDMIVIAIDGYRSDVLPQPGKAGTKQGRSTIVWGKHASVGGPGRTPLPSSTKTRSAVCCRVSTAS